MGSWKPECLLLVLCTHWYRLTQSDGGSFYCNILLCHKSNWQLKKKKKHWCVTLPCGIGVTLIIGVYCRAAFGVTRTRRGALLRFAMRRTCTSLFISKSLQRVEKLKNVRAEQQAGINPVRQIQNLQNKRTCSHPGTSAAPSTAKKSAIVHTWVAWQPPPPPRNTPQSIFEVQPQSLQSSAT